MGILAWFLGSNEDAYVRPHRESRGLSPYLQCESVSCLGCGAGNGTPCKCDPTLGRPRKWSE